MMRPHPALWLALLLLGGCSDDDGTTPADSGPPPIDQCQTAADLGIVWTVAEALDGGIPDAGGVDAGPPYAAVAEVTYLVADCMQGECSELLLAESPDLPACVAGCLAGSPAEGLGAACTLCWSELTWCAADNCLTVCATDPRSLGCEECTGIYCEDRFQACTGFFGEAP